MDQTHTEATLPKVIFYTKAGCHLCDEAREMLDEIAGQKEYELTEIDIRTSPDIFQMYRYRIPVITVDETIVAEGRIECEELVRAFGL